MATSGGSSAGPGLRGDDEFDDELPIAFNMPFTEIPQEAVLAKALNAPQPVPPASTGVSVVGRALRELEEQAP